MRVTLLRPSALFQLYNTLSGVSVVVLRIHVFNVAGVMAQRRIAATTSISPEQILAVISF